MSKPERGVSTSIDIDALLQNTWLQVISLRYGPIFQEGEGRMLWERCIADVERVQRELKASDLDEASCQHILTAQCALLDEAVKGRGVEDDACVQWYGIPLQGYFLGTMDAGDTLCDRMRAVLRDLPEASWRQPVVLFCGDLPLTCRQPSPVFTGTQGCWIRVTDHQDLVQVAQQVLSLRPDWGRQLSVMVSQSMPVWKSSAV